MPALTQAQKEALMVWTYLTTNSAAMTNATTDSVMQTFNTPTPLSINGPELQALVDKATSELPDEFGDLRTAFQQEGVAAASVGGDGSNPWPGEGLHPSIAELRDTFGLNDA